jgi:chromatin remodeling complex protein RSC6
MLDSEEKLLLEHRELRAKVNIFENFASFEEEIVVLNKRIEVLKKIEMLKHDSSEETKTYSADSYERKKSAERAKNKGLKKDIIDIQEKAIYESHENKLVYTYVLKDIQKNIYKIGKTADPHARFKSLCVRGKVLQ